MCERKQWAVQGKLLNTQLVLHQLLLTHLDDSRVSIRHYVYPPATKDLRVIMDLSQASSIGNQCYVYASVTTPTGDRGVVVGSMPSLIGLM